MWERLYEKGGEVRNLTPFIMIREARRTELRAQISQEAAAGVASTVDDFMVFIITQCV